MAQSSLRSQSVVDFVGTISEDLPGTKLPTNREVLCVFFHHLKKNHSVRKSASFAVSQVNAVWSKTKIPIIQDIRGIEKIEKLYQEWRNITKHTKDRQPTADSVMRREKFGATMEALFDVSKKDAEALLLKREFSTTVATEKSIWKEERIFLLDQRGPRLCSIGGIDIKMWRRECKKKAAFERTLDQRRQLDERRKKDFVQRTLTDETSQLESESSVQETDDDELINLPPKKKRGRVDVITPEVTEIIDVAKLSSSTAAKLLAAVSSAVGVPVEETNINRTSIQTKRGSNRKDTRDKIMDSFEPDPVLTVHWDGKIVPALQGRELQDRQAVIVTGVTTNQLLGVPAVPDGTSKQTSLAVHNLLKLWRVEIKTKAMSFDTTNVNTGWIKGAAVELERLLGRSLLWLPCRYHIFERVFFGLFHEVMGVSTGPDIAIFKEFQKKWATIDKTKYLTYEAYAESRSQLEPYAEMMIKFAVANIQSGQPRSDYLELLELAIIFLGGVPPGGIRFKAPGAIHLARWMAKIIYCIKMCLFRKQTGLERNVSRRLLQVTVFAIILYLQVWFTSSHPLSAPRYDLNCLKGLVNYESVNSRIAKAAQKRSLSHLWYLSEEMIGFAVFDEELTNEERSKIVGGIFNREEEEEPLKRRVVQLCDVKGMTLGDLATKRTGTIFEILGIPMDFLNCDVETWLERDDYKSAKIVVSNLKVVNDHAERAVKLMSDYNRSVTQNEEEFQGLLINVQKHRSSFPDAQKRTLVSNYRTSV